jgi:transcriptional regulator with XRE-family HTH domain
MVNVLLRRFIERRSFGERLARRRTYKGVSQEALASSLNVPKERVVAWESDSEIPNREMLIAIIRRLKMNREVGNTFLLHCGYETLALQEFQNLQNTGTATDERAFLVAEERDVSEWIVGSYSASAQIDTALQLETQLNDLQANIQAQLRQIQQTYTENKSLTTELRNALLTVAQVRVTAQQLSADVILPAPEDMQVKLVSASSFEQLEEYRNEQSKWFSIAGIFVGAALGIIVNTVTGGVWTSEAVILIAVALGLASVMGVTATTYQKRAERLRNRIVSGPSSSTKVTSEQDS